MRIKLEAKPESNGWRNPDLETITIREALPFIKNKRAKLIHRIRFGVVYRFPKYGEHMAMTHHCGLSVTGRHDKLTFLSSPDDNDVVCQRCEDMALERGLPASETLAGKHVHTGGVKLIMNCCGQGEK